MANAPLKQRTGDPPAWSESMIKVAAAPTGQPSLNQMVMCVLPIREKD